MFCILLSSTYEKTKKIQIIQHNRNRARGVYQGKLNVVFDSFDRLITLQENTVSQAKIDASRDLAEELIQAGKTWSDSSGIRMNFVCSEGSLGNFAAIAGSGASKRMFVNEIAEIDKTKAVKYIKDYYKIQYKSDLDDTEAQKMYQECGGLFTDMRNMVLHKDISSFNQSKYRSFGSDFTELGIYVDQCYKSIPTKQKQAWKLLEVVAKDGKISYAAAMDMVGHDAVLLDKLSSKKGPLFLSVDTTDPKFEFVSTPMKHYIERVVVDCKTLIN